MVKYELVSYHYFFTGCLRGYNNVLGKRIAFVENLWLLFFVMKLMMSYHNEKMHFEQNCTDVLPSDLKSFRTIAVFY